ncbi:MAG: hypothetical protein IPK00_13945 [Deltaproteobacteria bacterium]|nr:hypothetical protein [Deltaproteobacteria bacterium]
MKLRVLAIVGVAFVLALFASSAQAQTLKVQRPVPYSEDGDISDKIKQECKIDEQLADFLQEYAREQGVEVEFTDRPVDTAAGRVLDLRIVSAISMGNAFIGHQKSTGVAGTLYENGKKVASFKARRQSMGGAFGGYKGSCAVLGRTVKVIAQDIAGWLKSPSDGAKLGDS